MWKIVRMSILCLCTALAMTACSSDQTGSEPLLSDPSPQGTGEQGATEEDFVEFEIMGYFVMNVDPDDDILQEINRMFNVSIRPTFTSIENYTETLNMRISSGDIPDWFRVGAEDLFTQLVNDDVLVNLSEAADRYGLENMKAQFDLPEANLLMKNGAFYRSPDYNGYLQPNFYLRGDWLDRLGLDTPRTFEDLKTVLQAFVENDPDGNGTVGLTLLGNDNYAGFINNYSAGWTGYIGWGLVNGQLSYAPVDPAYKEHLRYWADLFDSGLIDTEMFSNSWESIMQKFASGRAGALLMNMNQLWWDNNEGPLTVYKEDAYIRATVPPPAGPLGSIIGRGIPFSSDSVFSAHNPEEKIERMLRVMDYLLSDQGRELTLYGIEGRHHDIVNGEKVQRSSVLQEWGQGQHILGEIADFGSNDLAARSPQVLEWFDWQQQPGNVVYNRVEKFASSESIRYSTSVVEVVNQWIVRFVTGDADIDDSWDAYLQEVDIAGLETWRDLIAEYVEENGIELVQVSR